MYCAIIGDIIDSRKITSGRSETQEKFKAALHRINNHHSASIKSNFEITAGDAFYGLLSTPETLLQLVLEIRLALVPHQIRIGIGFGGISTEIEKYHSNLIDGSANSTAREAIDYLSENKNKYESVYRTTFLKVDDREYDTFGNSDSYAFKTCKTYENFINTLFVACSSIEKKWDTKHAEVITLKMRNYTQREIAQELGPEGPSQPAVQRRLKSADFYLYEYYQKAIESHIAALWKELHYA